MIHYESRLLVDFRFFAGYSLVGSSVNLTIVQFGRPFRGTLTATM